MSDAGSGRPRGSSLRTSGMTSPTRRSLLRAAATGAVLGLTGCAGTARRSPATGVSAAPGHRQVYRYGASAAQVAELSLPAGAASGVVVLVHGGYWQAGYDRHLQDAVAADLVQDGWAVWNVDYRGVGDGGGWPSTFADVAAAVDLLAQAAREHDLPLHTVPAVGHSAGGTLALWLAARPGLAAGAVGAAPAVRLTAVVTQAGVNDLVAGSRARLGGGAVDSVLGGSPADVPERYDLADPRQRLPLDVPLLVATGAQDEVVPASQSRDFAASARAAGDDVRLVEAVGEGHFAPLEPRSDVWAATRTWLRQHRERTS